MELVVPNLSAFCTVYQTLCRINTANSFSQPQMFYSLFIFSLHCYDVETLDFGVIYTRLA